MVEHKTLCSSLLNGFASAFIPFLKAVLSAYEWESNSNVTEGLNYSDSNGIYYFTANSAIKFESTRNVSGKIKIINSGSVVKTISVSGQYVTFSVGTTSKGVCICFAGSGTQSRYNSMSYNIFIGDCTLNGQTVKGCICVDDSGNLTIATDNGISTETALGTTINADRKAVLVPIANTTTGEIFSDIFVMRYSPIQYNIMDVDGQGIFLCGKALALKD